MAITVIQQEKKKNWKIMFRKLESVSNEHEKYQQVFVVFMELKNTVKDHDNKIKVIEKNDKFVEKCRASLGRQVIDRANKMPITLKGPILRNRKYGRI